MDAQFTQTYPIPENHWGIRLDHSGRARLINGPFFLDVHVKDAAPEDRESGIVINIKVTVNGGRGIILTDYTSLPVAQDLDGYMRVDLMSESLTNAPADARYALRDIARAYDLDGART